MNNIKIHDKDFEIFLEKDIINKRILLMGIQLNIDYEKKSHVFIGVLNGCFMFMADLMKEIEIPCEVNFIKVSSYQGDTSTGQIK
jgi:hypoxanthine phosphoribosyltransferase